MEQYGQKWMFRGKFSPALEDNNRLKLPTPFKNVIKSLKSNEFLGMRGLDGAVQLIPPVYWQKIEDKIKEKPNTERNRFAVRELYLTMINISIDKNFRIIVPRELLELGSIEKEIVLLGMGEKIEIWNPEILSSKLNEFKPSLDNVFNDVLIDSGLI